MTPEAADALAGSSAAYIHIPFCARVCPYCDFAVVAGRDDLAERYTEAVVKEIGRTDRWRPLESVYFGGGTPSHVDPSLLARILGALEVRHGIASTAEVSLEANPEDFTVDRGRGLTAAGFNRVSFGAQSLDEGVLVSLGRRHRARDALAAVESARDAGFGNVSIDLMFGTPGETDGSWAETVEGALSSGVDHVSSYALTVEPGTPLGRDVRAGAPAPDPDTQADRWEHANAALTHRGLFRYEVSNWASPGSECRYNMTVWAQGEYLAHGMGAHEFIGGFRRRNLRRLDPYIEAVEAGQDPIAASEPIEGWDAELDRLFVGLRRAVGVSHGPGTARLAAEPAGARLFDAGVMADTGDRLVVTRPLLTDLVHRTLLGLSRWEEPVGTDNVSG